MTPRQTTKESKWKVRGKAKHRDDDRHVIFQGQLLRDEDPVKDSGEDDGSSVYVIDSCADEEPTSTTNNTNRRVVTDKPKDHDQQSVENTKEHEKMEVMQEEAKQETVEKLSQ